MANGRLTPVDTIDERAINIYCDGSSYGNPRRGGMGIRYVTVDSDGHEVTEALPVPGHLGATNNEMELLACVKALDALIRGKTTVSLQDFDRVILKTDSRYVVDNLDRARWQWQSSGWMTRSGTPVISADLWKDLLKKISQLRIRFELKWVKGHKQSAHNKAVDKLAKQSAGNALLGPLKTTSVARRLTDKATEVGSVQAQGRRLTIRIVTWDYQRVQRMTRYRFEVVAKSSKWFGLVDIAFADVSFNLRRNRTYMVGFAPIAQGLIITAAREIPPKQGPSTDPTASARAS